MLGHRRPCRPFCLPQNYQLLDLPSGILVRRALAFVLVCLAFSGSHSSIYGQRIQFPKENTQKESIRNKPAANAFIGLEPAFKSDWSISTLAIEQQTRSLITRSELLPLLRSDLKRIVDRPRLADIIKSRELPLPIQGHLQPLTFEHGGVELFQAYSQSLDRQFSDIPHATFESPEALPVAVRQSRSDRQLFFYIANASPWRLQIRLQLKEEISKQTIRDIQSLTQAKFEPTNNPDATQSLTVVLDPYDIADGATDAFGPIESYTFEYLGDVAAELRKRVFGLQVKLQRAQQAKPLRLLSNPEFLPIKSTKSAIDGWEIGRQPPSRFNCLNDSISVHTIREQSPISLASKSGDNQTSQSVSVNTNRMKSHLQIHSSAEQTTWIRSQPIAPTETGRLSISVWLRIPLKTGEVLGTNQTPDIRIAIDGRTQTNEYYRFGVVGKEPGNSLASLRDTWKRFVVHFDELPNDLTDLRIGFDVVGDGLIHVGHVELFDRWFDNSQAKAITQLLASADAMLRHPAQFDRCRRLLEEPWAVFLDDHFSLTPTPKTAQKPVPMFKPKAAQPSTAEQKQDDLKAGRSLTR